VEFDDDSPQCGGHGSLSRDLLCDGCQLLLHLAVLLGEVFVVAVGDVSSQSGLAQ
jgi:hypothetical protein